MGFCRNSGRAPRRTHASSHDPERASFWCALRRVFEPGPLHLGGRYHRRHHSSGRGSRLRRGSLGLGSPEGKGSLVNEIVLLLVYAAPVAFAALGETVVQKSGVINIGLEGAMLGAAYVALIATQATGSPLVGLLAGTVVGLLAVLLFGVFTVLLAADQVVVGTAINLLGLGATGALFRNRFGQSGSLLSVPRLPQIFVGIDLGLLLLLAAVPVIWFLLNRTGWGLALRSAGEYPKAVEASGFRVEAVRMQALAVGGVLAGLAGAYLTVGITGSFTENVTGGRGFVAIAVVTFGRWKPVGVLLAALLIGLAESLQFVLQARGVAVPYQLLLALPYVVALLVLVIAGRGTAAPASLGVPYRREG
ncbi:ABC transporter permease [bacterium]|nr:MAG: ABC transporter permease [bacterium]